ncbi:ubiquitin-conjugating enzyme E2 C-like [Phyllostomus discolor]|uniref:Ubiquitin-conjugating enzyme E2 C-like n=1 Tax=Phyllostomus discolor TaxID=89673 RepID=A0A7E6CTX8_9CHIR|nr:ubiquitin-conjugating enzyme E2 C-like [Phyllostomus discolor]
MDKMLQQELMTLVISGNKEISAFPESDNLFRYKLTLELPSGFPYNAPTVIFLTSCYRPNMDTQSSICPDILKDQRFALYDVGTLLLSIRSLPGEPTVDCPLSAHAAELWENPNAFEKYMQETYGKQVSSREPGPGLSSPSPCAVLFFLRWSVLALISLYDSVSSVVVSYLFCLCFLNQVSG